MNILKLSPHLKSTALLALLCLVTLRPAMAWQQPAFQPQTGAFATPVTDALIDDAASADWTQSGSQQPLANPKLLHQLVWTQTAAPANLGFLQYGVSKEPGIRHLRLGFHSPIAIGSILVRGGDQISVLKPGAAYPGNLADDSQWVDAQRIVNRAPSTAPVDTASYALWTLPQASTRALRFTHNASPSDANDAGAVGGIYLLSQRFTNLATQADVAASANTQAAPMLIDEKNNDWHGWDNGPGFSHPVTAANPEWIILSWPHPVALRGLAALWAGFNTADVQTYAGSNAASAKTAPESQWQSLGRPYTLANQYPRSLGVNWLDFGKTVTTSAIRLRMTSPTTEGHPHLKGKTQNGNRVWLGEIVALSPITTSNLDSAVLPAAKIAVSNPPIPIHFKLDKPAFVTLVIEDAKGNRVRNLVSDTKFEAGDNTAWWDGTDDLGRNNDAADHGVYLIPTHFVDPGHYTVRGLLHDAIDLHYEFSFYNAGNPAWETADGSGGWLTNHTPPSSTLFVPADKAPGGKPLVFLGSYISEGGSGLAWVDLDGHKQGGRGWIGGNWTAAPYLARDISPSADASTYAYVGAVWSADAKNSGDPSQHQAIVRLTALTTHGDKAILNFPFDTAGKLDHDERGWPDWTTQMGGLAVNTKLAVVSLSMQNQLLFADVTGGKALGLLPVESPRGLAFDKQSRLLVLSGNSLLRYNLPSSVINPQQLPQPQTIISSGLDDPAGITTDSAGNIYISNRGLSNQVLIISENGKVLRTIGHAGPSKAGPYDQLHLNNPRGLTIDSNQHLWVAEEDFQPKRVSEWTLDGQLVKAFYGPSEYGGGGSLDPVDKTKLYYHAMQFNLDWTHGTNTVSAILYRPSKDSLPLPKGGTPETVLYSGNHRYFTNAYLGSPTNGVNVAMLYLDEGGTIKPVAAFGKANEWSPLQTDALRTAWPQGVNLASDDDNNMTLFTWSDLNGDGKVQANEVSFQKSLTGWITIMPDLSILDAFVAGRADASVGGKAMRYLPSRVLPNGLPVYDLNKAQILADGAQKPKSDGGGQALYSPADTVLTTAPSPFTQQSLGGIDQAGHRWSYPNLWPGLHPSHSAPVADHPGEVLGATHLLGGFIHPAGSTTKPLWAINANFGDIDLFTADGLFVTQLFQDVRTGKPWSMPNPQRNMTLNDISLHDENFFPSITQTADGNIYLLDGGHTSIVRVDGLTSLRTIAPVSLDLSASQIQQAQNYLKQREVDRQTQSGTQTLEVAIRQGPAPALNQLPDALKNASWATIDRRITKVGWADKPDVTEAAVTIAAGHLLATFRNSDPNLLNNSGAITNAPFKRWSALDLMIGTDPRADPKRTNPVTGDIRLLIYQVKGQTRATLYRAVVPGTASPVPFSSPGHTINLDEVKDVSSQVQLVGGNGVYSISVPLDVMGLHPAPGQSIKADIGILRGNGMQTVQRVYWSNKATGITSDVPTEAALTPNLWGQWTFKSQ